MELFIYADESGVFDYLHNDYYTYGGLIICGRSLRDSINRKYISAEKNIGNAYPKGIELKASVISKKHKKKLYKSLSKFVKFGAIISQKELKREIFNHKFSRQRYLDYAFKLSLKNALLQMSNDKFFELEDIEKLNIFFDQHTTATDGIYELKQSLLMEFKFGTFNYNWNIFFPPIFPNLKDINLQYCDSSKVPLIRASDIIANRLYYLTLNQLDIDECDTIYVKNFP